MSHMAITEFCIFYFLSFSVLMYIAGIGGFPPPPITFTLNIPILIYTINVPITIYWAEWIFAMVTLTIGIVVAINVIPQSASVIGTGITFNPDRKQLSTICVGLCVAGALGFTMLQMLPSSTPLIVSMMLVFPFVGLMAYSIIIDAGTHN